MPSARPGRARRGRYGHRREPVKRPSFRKFRQQFPLPGVRRSRSRSGPLLRREFGTHHLPPGVEPRRKKTALAASSASHTPSTGNAARAPASAPRPTIHASAGPATANAGHHTTAGRTPQPPFRNPRRHRCRKRAPARYDAPQIRPSGFAAVHGGTNEVRPFAELHRKVPASALTRTVISASSGLVTTPWPQTTTAARHPFAADQSPAPSRRDAIRTHRCGIRPQT